MGGGTVLDLGVFLINIVEMAFKGETPEKVEAVGQLNKNGVDYDFAAALQFKNNRSATIASQSLVQLPNEAVIVGTKGTIRFAPTFISTQSLCQRLTEFKFPTPVLKMNYGSDGLCYQANEVRKCLKAGLLESSRKSHTDSLTISKIQDQIRKQIGVKYDVD